MDISTVPVHYVNALLRSAEQHGLDIEQVLRQTGVDLALIENDRVRIPSTSFVKLSDYLTEKLQDENAGMMAQRTKPGSFAMMCHACINCATLGDFLQRCAQFNALVNDCVVMQLERGAEQARYSIAPLPGAIDRDELIILILLGITHRLASWAIGQTLTLDSVDIARERPSFAHEYNFLFMAPIQFNRQVNSLRFTSSYLDMPIVQNEQDLSQFLSRPSINLMTGADENRSLTAKIRALIKGDVAGSFPEFTSVANSLHLTTATLRRRLRAEGSSYQQLKDDIRRDTAIHLLSRGTISLDEVAHSTGFSEPTSFFRAFKRWTGVTPRAYISKPVTSGPAD